VVSLPQALEDAADNLYRTARNIAATWQLAQAFEAKRR
jgi:glycerate kinase